MKDKKIFPLSILIISICLYFGFSLHHLTKFITADEHYWIYDRIPQYWRAWDTFTLRKTFINDKPGITVALVSGFGMIWEKNPETLCNTDPEHIVTCDTSRTEKILFLFRLPIIFVNILMIIYIFWITKKLTNAWVASWSALLIALSPMLVGISQIINPDALLWSFTSAAILSLLALLRFQKNKYVALSGIFLALAILTKYVASILVPFFILALAIWIIKNMFENPDQKNALFLLRRNLYFIFIIIAISISLIAILLPAIFTKPGILQMLFSGGSEKPLYLIFLLSLIIFSIEAFILNGKTIFSFFRFLKKMGRVEIYGRIIPVLVFTLFISLLVGRTMFPGWSLFENLPFDLKDITSDVRNHGPNPNFLESALLESNPIAFSLTPITLFLFMAFLLRSSISKKGNEEWEFESGMLILLMPIYMSAFALMDILATPRYLIIFYPLVSILAAMEIWQIKCFLEKKYSKQYEFFLRIIMTILIFAFSSASLIMINPFYFNYTNFILPKKNLIHSSWGYGGYEAAQYLNNIMPNAKNALIWSDYEGVCEFFKGKCMLKNYLHPPTSQKFDYAVITRRGEILYNPDHIRWLNKKNLNMTAAYKKTDPDWSLEIDDRPGNYIRVVKVSNPE